MEKTFVRENAATTQKHKFKKGVKKLRKNARPIKT
jgi:hypothetical protein